MSASSPWDEQELVYLPTLWASASLALFGELSLVAVYLLVPSQRSFFFKLVVYMAAFQVGGSVAWFLNTPSPTPTLCLTGAVLSTFFYVSTFLWSCCIAFAMLQTLRKSEENSRLYEVTFVAVCTVLPSICVAVPLAMGIYSTTVIEFEVGCWFIEQFAWARIVFFDFWILFAWLFNLIALILVQREFKGMTAFTKLTPTLSEAARSQRKLFVSLLGSFMLCWFWSLVLAVLAVIRDLGVEMDADTLFPVSVIFALFAPLQGFLNFLAFMVQSEEFRHNYIDLWRRLFCLRPRHFYPSLPHLASDPFLTAYTPYQEEDETVVAAEQPRSPRVVAPRQIPSIARYSAPANDAPLSSSFEANINGDGGIVPSAVLPRIARTSSLANSNYASGARRPTLTSSS